MSDEYKNHHYVPQWYQKKFMLPGEHELFHLDLKPETFMDPRGITHTRKALKRQGSKKCFVQDELYTTKVQGIEIKDIEKYFFGEIDTKGRPAVEYFEGFDYPLKDWGTSLEDVVLYMSTQKLRTPKGLSFLSNKIGSINKDNILRSMLRLRQLHSAIWMECVWLIADASQSDTKFIVSDHPVTVYNRECGPRSQWCRESNDPEIWLQGTYTIFPLSIDKVLILTNLSWVRNPYQSGIKPRPNPNPFRNAIFKFTDVQVRRQLSEQEVREINFIIKSRAARYIAAAKEEWLYPEKYASKSDWNKYGHGYLLMPDPRSIHWGGTIMWGGGPGGPGAMDEYGRLPGDPDFEAETIKGKEYETLPWFQGEFAALFGPNRRGRCMQALTIENERDSDDFHQYHLGLQKKKYKDRHKKKGA
ncbi:MAG: DUF4238 domain-containing protein [Patescibacteria group bacterium]